MLAIFLSNKLISCDTILPLAMEVHEKTGVPIRFITTDAKTYDVIRANVVLWDTIHRIGRLSLIGRRNQTFIAGIVARLKAIGILSPLIIMAWLRRAHLLHFKALNHPPLRLLTRLVPDSVYFCENTPYAFTALLNRVTEVKATRLRDQYLPSGGSLVAFDETWPWLSESRLRNLPRYVFGPPRSRKIWLDYVKDVSDRYHRSLLGASGGRQDETFVVMLGFFGALDYMREPDSVRRMFRELLSVLIEESGGRPIILKPHAITDLRILEEELRPYKARGCNILIAHLHPSVLAVRSRGMFANYYSTTLGDAFLMGVPTVEYTDYSDAALQLTERGSMCPEHVSYFIQADPVLLRQTIRNILATPRPPLPVGVSGDPSGLLDKLCFG